MHLILSYLLFTIVGAISTVTEPPRVPGVSFDRFITIWLAKQDYSKTVADPHFAALCKQGILLTRYFSLTHPSQPNYLAALAGDYFGLDHDNYARVPAPVSTVVDLLGTRNISWQGYFEGLPGPGYLAEHSDGNGDGTWDYVRKHNPFAMFDSITNEGQRLLNVRSFAQFKRDLDLDEVPQFVFMSPNMLNGGHNTTLDYAADYADTLIQPLLKPDAFGKGERTLIALTFDGNEDKGPRPNQVGTILLGNAIPVNLRGTEDATFYTHYSILSSIEANWHLPTLGRYDVGANIWAFMAGPGGGGENMGWRVNRDPDNAASVHNSVSYSGPLSQDVARRMNGMWPVPNLLLQGPSGLGVLKKVKMAFAARTKVRTPYDGSGRVVDGATNLPIYGSQGRNARRPADTI